MEHGEEALDSVEPRAGGRREVEGEARVSVEPLPHFRMLVGGVVVDGAGYRLFCSVAKPSRC